MTSLRDEEIRTGRAETIGQGGATADADLDDADSDGTDDSDSSDSSDSSDTTDDSDAVDPDTGPADSAG